jgi:hypothetical protein
MLLRYSDRGASPGIFAPLTDGVHRAVTYLRELIPVHLIREKSTENQFEASSQSDDGEIEEMLAEIDSIERKVCGKDPNRGEDKASASTAWGREDVSKP